MGNCDPSSHHPLHPSAGSSAALPSCPTCRPELGLCLEVQLLLTPKEASQPRVLPSSAAGTMPFPKQTPVPRFLPHTVGTACSSPGALWASPHPHLCISPSMWAPLPPGVRFPIHVCISLCASLPPRVHLPIHVCIFPSPIHVCIPPCPHIALSGHKPPFLLSCFLTTGSWEQFGAAPALKELMLEWKCCCSQPGIGPSAACREDAGSVAAGRNLWKVPQPDGSL